YALSVSLPVLNRLPAVWDTRADGSVDHVSYIASYMESFCRTMWGLAPILRDKEKAVFLEKEGRKLDVRDWFREELRSGLDPSSPKYRKKYVKHYDKVQYASQMSTVLAALALGIALNRETLWGPLEAAGRRRIGAWLSE